MLLGGLVPLEGQHVDGTFLTDGAGDLLLEPHGGDGDAPPVGGLLQRPDPAEEGVPEFVGVEAGEDPGDGVVRGDAVGQGQEGLEPVVLGTARCAPRRRPRRRRRRRRWSRCQSARGASCDRPGGRSGQRSGERGTDPGRASAAPPWGQATTIRDSFALAGAPGEGVAQDVERAAGGAVAVGAVAAARAGPAAVVAAAEVDVGPGQVVDAGDALGGIGAVLAGSKHASRKDLPGDTSSSGELFTEWPFLSLQSRIYMASGRERGYIRVWFGVQLK